MIKGISVVALAVKDLDQATQKFDFLLEQPISGQFGTVNFIHPKLVHGVQIELSNPDQKV